MNASKIFTSVCAAILLLTLSGSAQELLQLKFQGKCLGTNESGQIVKQNVNNTSILKEFADRNGITNLSSLALVYHVAGDERGDVIEVVNAATSEIVWQVYGLLFPVDLPSGDGSQLSRFVYMYNDQQSVSMGSGMLKERISLDRHGKTNRSITGDLQFYLLPDSSNGLRTCTATISASKIFTTNAPPNFTNIFPQTASGPQP
jgi:hypothetical protein